MSKEKGKLLLLEAQKRKYKKWFVISIAFVMVSLGLFQFSSDLSMVLAFVGFLGAGILYVNVLAIQREIKAEIKAVENRRLRQKQIIMRHAEARRDEKVFNFGSAIKIYEELGEKEEVGRVKKLLAHRREKARDYDAAINIYEELGEIEEAARVRKLKARQGSVRVAQKVVHGDEITKTDIRDSVVSKSSIGAGEDDKISKLEKIVEMKDKGIIDDAEFQQMKKEILGK